MYNLTYLIQSFIHVLINCHLLSSCLWLADWESRHECHCFRADASCFLNNEISEFVYFFQ